MTLLLPGTADRQRLAEIIEELGERIAAWDKPPAAMMAAERRLVDALALHDEIVASVADEPIEDLREKLERFGKAATEAAALVRPFLE